MGTNRRFHKIAKTEKVHQSLMEDFGLTKEDIYKVWLSYIHELAKGNSQKDIIDKLKKSKDISIVILDYYVALGLTIIKDIMCKEIDGINEYN